MLFVRVLLESLRVSWYYSVSGTWSLFGTNIWQVTPLRGLKCKSVNPDITSFSLTSVQFNFNNYSCAHFLCLIFTWKISEEILTTVSPLVSFVKSTLIFECLLWVKVSRRLFSLSICFWVIFTVLVTILPSLTYFIDTLVLRNGVGEFFSEIAEGISFLVM